MFYRTWQGASGRFVAECKRTPFEYKCGPDHYRETIREDGDVWFEFGATAEQAIANLKASMPEEPVA